MSLEIDGGKRSAEMDDGFKRSAEMDKADVEEENVKNLISEQMMKMNIKRDWDVHKLSLSNSLLTVAPCLKNYKNLNRLNLNNNKMFHLGNGLRYNYVLTELYLENNRLVEINNTLQHLRCLQTLALNGNQLTSLTDVAHELRLMQDLTDLNLSMNPLSQDYTYRHYIIYSIKSLNVFDNKRISLDEREQVERRFTDKMLVKDSIAFGRRVRTSNKEGTNSLDMNLDKVKASDSIFHTVSGEIHKVSNIADRLIQ